MGIELFFFLLPDAQVEGVVEKANDYFMRPEYGGHFWLAFPDCKPGERCHVAELIKASVGKNVRVFGIIINGDYPAILIRKVERRGD